MIPVQNVYYMLSYAFKVLNEQGYKRIATEEFNNTAELMAAILAKGIAVQLKRGLGKEYISQTEDLSSLRGKIDIAESIKTQSMLGLDCLQASTSGWSSSSVSPISRAPIAFSAPTLPP